MRVVCVTSGRALVCGASQPQRLYIQSSLQREMVSLNRSGGYSPGRAIEDPFSKIQSPVRLLFRPTAGYHASLVRLFRPFYHLCKDRRIERTIDSSRRQLINFCLEKWQRQYVLMAHVREETSFSFCRRPLVSATNTTWEDYWSVLQNFGRSPSVCPQQVIVRPLINNWDL